MSAAISLWQKTDGRHSTLSLIDVSSLRNSDSRRWAPEMPLETYRSTTASTEIFEMLKTISLRAHWYRQTQKSALRPHGNLFRPSVKENWATKRISVVLWNKHVCENFSDLLHISSNTGMQLHKSGSKWQCVLYGRFHMRLKALRHAVQKADKLPPDNYTCTLTRLVVGELPCLPGEIAA